MGGELGVFFAKISDGLSDHFTVFGVKANIFIRIPGNVDGFLFSQEDIHHISCFIVIYSQLLLSHGFFRLLKITGVG